VGMLLKSQSLSGWDGVFDLPVSFGSSV